MNNLFGYKVTYYVKDNEAGEATVILAMPQKDQNSTVEITAELFEGITEKNGKKVSVIFKCVYRSLYVGVWTFVAAEAVYCYFYHLFSSSFFTYERLRLCCTLLKCLH